jgi:hypothetical protein
MCKYSWENTVPQRIDAYDVARRNCGWRLKLQARQPVWFARISFPKIKYIESLLKIIHSLFLRLVWWQDSQRLLSVRYHDNVLIKKDMMSWTCSSLWMFVKGFGTHEICDQYYSLISVWTSVHSLSCVFILLLRLLMHLIPQWGKIFLFNVLLTVHHSISV